jgi:hypothetical protein
VGGAWRRYTGVSASQGIRFSQPNHFFYETG